VFLAIAAPLPRGVSGLYDICTSELDQRLARAPFSGKARIKTLQTSCAHRSIAAQIRHNAARTARPPSAFAYIFA
jgi:hypothetical protein